MKRKFQFNIAHTIIAMSICVSIILISSFVIYNDKLNIELNTHTKENLTTNSNVASQDIVSQLDNITADLKSISTVVTYSYLNDLSSIDFTQLQTYYSDYTGTIDYLVGDSLSSLIQSNTLNEVDAKMVDIFLHGDNFYFDQSNPDDLKLYVFVSLLKDKTEIGLLRCCYSLDNIKNVITSPTFSGEGTAYIFQASDTSFINHRFKSTPTCDDFFSSVDLLSSFNSSTFKSNLKNRKSGIVQYTDRGIKKYVQYYPLGINDWFVFNIVPASVLNKQAETISTLASMLAAIIVVVMVLLILFITGIQYYNNRKNRLNQEKLILEKERYYTVLQHSNSGIWEYNLASDVLTKSDPDLGIYSGLIEIPHFNKTMLKLGVIFQDDISLFNQFCLDLRSGNKDIKVELRAKDISNQFIWFELSGTTLYDNNGTPVSVIGQSNNINEFKIMLEELQDNSQRDALTKLYNCTATADKINNILTSTNSPMLHAFFILDINHFKSINESLGHLFGDALLIELSGKILKLVNPSDIVGRIGGDEFIIFLNNVASTEYVSQKANDIISIFKQIYTGEEEHLAVSGAIGIALYPRDGNNFDSLLTQSDIALSYAKFNDKNSFCIYSEEMSPTMNRSHLVDNAHNDSPFQLEERSLIDSSIIANTVNVLFDAKEIDISINMILGLIGRYYNLDHLFIIEYVDNQQYSNMTYEWAMNHSQRILKNVQQIPIGRYVHLTYYKDSANGVFYSNDINEILSADDTAHLELLGCQSTKGFLQCAFVENGVYQGYVGASFCESSRDWTKNEIDSLTLLSKIIGGYLLKLRTQEKVIQMERRDTLTFSYNVPTFCEIANKIILENSNQKYVIVHTDICNFKYLNETYGYSQGDHVLISFAKILGKTTGANEIFGRVTADRFICLLKYENKKELLNRLKIVNLKLNRIKKTETDYFKLAIRFGIYQIGMYQNDSLENMSTNIDRANIARKSIRNLHKSTCVFFNESMKSSILKQKEIEDVMEEALINNEFLVYYQPKINLDTNVICGAEALVRWNKSGEGLLPPIDFIPIFEDNQFIVSIDFFVFEEVCKYIKKLITTNRPVVPISVNFSRVHLKTNTCISRLKAILNQYKIPPHLLEIEITESALAESDHSLITLVDGIHQLGMKLSMDDFGSGLSSLNLLRKLPFDVIKLDKGFFQEGKSTERERVVITNIVKMAKELKMAILSEGVETEEQAQFLRDINCSMAQGYLFARPMPQDEFEKRYC